MPARTPRKPDPDRDRDRDDIDDIEDASRRAWERRPDESQTAYRAALAYFEMGSGRSMDAAREKLGKTSGYLRVMEKWSSDHEWVARADAFDAHQESIRHEADDAEARHRARETARRRVKAKDDLYDIAQEMKSKLRLMLKFPVQKTKTETTTETRDNGRTVVNHVHTEINPAKWTFQTLSRFVRTLAEIEAYALDEIPASELGSHDRKPPSPAAVRRARAVLAGRDGDDRGDNGDRDAPGVG